MAAPNFQPQPQDNLINQALYFENLGDYASAQALYRQALAYCSPGSPQAQDLQLRIQNLERYLPAAPTPPPSETDTYFDGAMQAFSQQNLKVAAELMSEVVRRNPGFTRNGYSAQTVLADIVNQMQAQPSETKSATPPWGIILGVVLIVVVLGIGAFLLFGNKQASPTQEPIKTPDNNPQVATTIVTPSDGGGLTILSPTPTPTQIHNLISTTPTPTWSPSPTWTSTFTPTIPPGGIGPACSQIGQTWTSGDNAVMVCVPAGEFLMGSVNDKAADVDEEPQHRVNLSAYWIDMYEVTNGKFGSFITSTGYQTEAERAGGGDIWIDALDTTQPSFDSGAYWKNPLGDGSGIDSNHPVTQVSWYDAKAYCEWAGKRLPSEAEWEKAARGTDGRRYPWGSWDGTLANHADSSTHFSWSESDNDGYQYTSPVGAFSGGASPYYALDMTGNVWEWTADWYDANYYKSRPNPDINPTGPASGTYRVSRGGSWAYVSWMVRPAIRYGYDPFYHRSDIGFRCAISAP
jgi:formylglycine-generating enzyme required for sulfatase activity